MKKILLLSIIIFMMGLNTTNAREITFNEIANKYKEKYDFNALDEGLGYLFANLEENSTVTTSGNTINITYKYNNEEFKTTFTYENNVINYKYAGPRELTETTTWWTVADAGAIYKLFFIILEQKGYSKTDIVNDLSKITADNMNEMIKGIEYTMYNFTATDSTSTASTSGIDTMKLDINKFDFPSKSSSSNSSSNLNGSSSNNNSNITSNNSENTENDIKNPNTGYKTYIISSLLILITLLILTKIKNKQDLIHKI